ncbi:hypothetical protein LB518_06850 [Mesorhizobium sp. BR1-1-16]|uniref:hypothetical protein n=1 Tax=Mesorhizobium sp. BR1-1-16 TaxID=2876653 RepID=UPI001CCA5E00|nr:hypothetical protein [Mesorhizobium sp. BR1-1-16]MBZ9936004.1 hypothetical protein [Mesorhizobium sp. BR1-1-16]
MKWEIFPHTIGVSIECGATLSGRSPRAQEMVVLAAGKFAVSMIPARSWSEPKAIDAGPALLPLFCAADAGQAQRIVARRFQPRLAAGFDETAGDGLRDFDRIASPFSSPAFAIALVLSAAMSLLILSVLLLR